MPKKQKKTEDRHVKNPVLEFKLRCQNFPHTLRLWAGNQGQVISCSEQRCHQFFISKTASLVYEDQSSSMHSAVESALVESDVKNSSNWKWIETWMERGFLEAGYMLPEDSKHWMATTSGWQQRTPDNGSDGAD